MVGKALALATGLSFQIGEIRTMSSQLAAGLSCVVMIIRPSAILQEHGLVSRQKVGGEDFNDAA